jgi:multiple antibiotic resistance protein
MLIELFRPYIIAFISIFIATDILGNIPIFLALTEKFSHKQKQKLINESIVYGLIIIIGFVMLGKYVMSAVGITLPDFKIAGGILLLVLSINLLVNQGFGLFRGERRFSDIGIFPLATPLIAGPALFTISLIIQEKFGLAVLLSMLILNMAISWLILEKSHKVIKLFGERGTKSFSKIFEILLSAFAVMMIRQGIIEGFFK